MSQTHRPSVLVACTAVLALLGGQPDQAAAQAREELVYSGRPEWTIQGESMEVPRSARCPPRKPTGTGCALCGAGGSIWASREDRELKLVSSGGDRFIVLSSAAGLIKLVDPAWDAARAPLRATDPTERFDYMEILHTQLGIVIYWGRGSGTISTGTTAD